MAGAGSPRLRRSGAALGLGDSCRAWSARPDRTRPPGRAGSACRDRRFEAVAAVDQHEDAHAGSRGRADSRASDRSRRRSCPSPPRHSHSPACRRGAAARSASAEREEIQLLRPPGRVRGAGEDLAAGQRIEQATTCRRSSGRQRRSPARRGAAGRRPIAAAQMKSHCPREELAAPLRRNRRRHAPLICRRLALAVQPCPAPAPPLRRLRTGEARIAAVALRHVVAFLRNRFAEIAPQLDLHAGAAHDQACCRPTGCCSRSSRSRARPGSRPA